MTNKLFVTKLSYKTTDKTLAAHFESYGKLIWCQVGPGVPGQKENAAPTDPPAFLSIAWRGMSKPGSRPV